jgi:outer membrane protein assembly factor BamB
LNWSYGTDGKSESGPVLAGGTVFLCCNDNSLYAVDAATGKERWYFTTSDSISATPVVAAGTVLFGSHDGNFYAVDAASGEERWRVETGSRIAGRCAIAGELAWFTNKVGVLIAVRVADGAVVHDFNRFKSPTSPVVSSGLVLFGSGHGVHAVDAVTGRDAWSAETFVPVKKTPAAADGIACFEAGDYLYAVAAETGKELWQHLLLQPLAQPVTISGGSVYFVDDNRVLTSLALSSGDEQWSYFTGCGSSCGAPVIAEDMIAVGCDSGLLGMDIALPGSGDAPGAAEHAKIVSPGPATGVPLRDSGLAYSNAQTAWHMYPLFLLGGTVYQYYWFFSNWKYLKLAGIREVNPGLRLLGLISPLLFGFVAGFMVGASGGRVSSQLSDFILAGTVGFTIFSLYLMYDLFRDIRNQARDSEVKSFKLALVTAAFFSFQNLPYFAGQMFIEFDIRITSTEVLLLVLIGIISSVAAVFFITFVQKASNRIWIKKNPGGSIRRKFTGGEFAIMAIFGTLQVLYMISVIAQTAVPVIF